MQRLVRLARWGLVLAWMVGIFALSAQPTLVQHAEPTVDIILKKLGHLTEYGVLALLAWWALQPAGSPARWRALAGPFAIAVLYAATDEWHQTGVPGRNGNVLDWAVDVAGAGLALVGLRVAWLRRGRGR